MNHCANRRGRLACALLACASLLWPGRSDGAIAAPATITGSIAGAAYAISMPTAWNGTLILYSHGYVVPGDANPAPLVGLTPTGTWLLAHHYALASSSYSATGWAVQQALHDDVALLDLFAARFGTPRRTIAWGHSLGGLITAALLERYPGRFDGGLPMCGVLAGGTAAWNSQLDAAFALNTLLAPSPGLQLTSLSLPLGLLDTALGIALTNQAQGTPAGRARLSLVAALGDLPGWFDAASPAPAPADYAAQEQNQYQWLSRVDAAFFFAARAELEGRAGGNPSWNTGVDYPSLLARSPYTGEVRALYARAGLSLDGDLAALQRASRIAADPAASSYLHRYADLDGRIRVPVLDLHTTGDGLVPVEHEADYAATVAAAGRSALLRQAYVARAGHCSFTAAEMIAAFQALIHRLDSGHWDDATSPAALQRAAAALGPAFGALAYGPGSAPPAFVPYRPARFPRLSSGVAGR